MDCARGVGERHGAHVEPVIDQPTNGESHAAGEHYRPNRAARRAYVRQRKVYKLVFEDLELAGLEVRAKGVPLGTFMELIDLASVFDDMDEESMSPEEAGKIRQLFASFGDVLVSWNVEEPVLDADGEETGETTPVPATIEGLYSQDIGFVFQIIQAWMGAIASVPAPLGQRSTDGAQSLEASMPMDVSSPSQAS